MISQHQLDQFHAFASEQVSIRGNELSWPTLFDLWRLENPTANEQAEIYAALDESKADVENGRVRPAADVMRDLRAKHRTEQ